MLRLDPWDLVSLEARSKKLEAACNVSALFRRFVSAFFAKSSMFMRFVSAFRRLTPFFFYGPVEGRLAEVGRPDGDTLTLEAVCIN